MTLRIARHLVRRALDQQRAVDQHRNAVGEREHQIHVVLDQEHGDVARQGRHRGEDIVALAFGNAGGGLVQQQHARFGGNRDRDLEQALLAVRQCRGELVHDVEQMEARQIFRDLGVDVVAGAHPPPPVAAAAEPFRYRKPDGLERRQIGIELVDLEGARQPAQHAGMHRHIGDVVAFQQDAAAIGLEHAGQQIDDGGLAGAVRADQGVAGALLDPERKLAGDLEPAELLFQPSGFQRERHGASLSGTATTALRPASCRMTRFGAHSTQRCRRCAADQHDHDQHEPDPELPVLRRDGRKHFLQHPEHHGADQPAVEIAGAADHQHQHQIGGALEREHVERGQLRGLGEQRAGDAGIERGQRVDRDQPPVDGDADRGGAQRIVP